MPRWVSTAMFRPSRLLSYRKLDFTLLVIQVSLIAVLAPLANLLRFGCEALAGGADLDVVVHLLHACGITGQVFRQFLSLCAVGVTTRA